MTLSSITLRAHRSPSPPLLAHGLPVKRFFDLFRVRALRALRFHHHHCSHMIIHETFSNYFECEHLVLPFMPSSPLLAHGLPVKRFLDLFQVRALRALRFHHHNCSYMIIDETFSTYFEYEHPVLPFIPSSPLFAHGCRCGVLSRTSRTITFTALGAKTTRLPDEAGL